MSCPMVFLWVTRRSSRLTPAMRGILWLLACLICLGATLAFGAGADTNSAAALRAKYIELGQQLSNNQFKRPLYLDSVDSSSHVRGEIYALLPYPFAVVNEALNDPIHWCDVLLLHLYTKQCLASIDKGDSSIVVNIGKKSYQLFDHVYRFEYSSSAATVAPEYFDVALKAKTGPMGTSDYRVLLEAVPVQGGQTFVHFTYSYAYDFVGRLAMETYLATVGSGKVGFTRTDTPSASQADYIGGARGVVERNTMRYYLAVEAYLAALLAPPQKRAEQRLQYWFTATEQYPRQLREVDRATYLEMKR